MSTLPPKSAPNKMAGRFSNSIVLLPLPAGPMKMEILLSNDDLISKSVKDTSMVLTVFVYYLDDR